MPGTSYGTAADGFNSDPNVDLTDDSGHGVIFCGQKMYLTIQPTTVNTTAVTRFNARVLFRWKNVSLTEYIGVVTSQLAQ